MLTNTDQHVTIKGILVFLFKYLLTQFLKECTGLYYPDKQLDLVNCMFASKNVHKTNVSAEEVIN